MSRHIRKTQHPNAATATATATATETLEAGARQIAASGSEMYASAIKQTKSVVKAMEKYVHQKPWYAVGAAAGIGVLLGLMLRRA